MTFRNIADPFQKKILHDEQRVLNNKELWNYFFKNSDLTACFVTLGQKEGGIYLSLGNHDQ